MKIKSIRHTDNEIIIIFKLDHSVVVYRIDDIIHKYDIFDCIDWYTYLGGDIQFNIAFVDDHDPKRYDAWLMMIREIMNAIDTKDKSYTIPEKFIGDITCDIVKGMLENYIVDAK